MEVLKLTTENFKEIISNNQTVLVDLYADWCGPCKMQAPIIEEIAKENDSFVVGKVNVDDEEDIAIEFRVNSIPTLLIFKSGELVKKFVGLTGKDTILNALK